jgi:hypothetical protein
VTNLDRELFGSPRYLHFTQLALRTRQALKAYKSSFKFGGILHRALDPKHCEAEFGNCVHSLMHGPALPVAIFLRFEFVEVGGARIFADALAHALRL